MYPVCICNEPTRNCPRYGWMKGRKWEHCQSIKTSEEHREAFLNIYSGKIPVNEPGFLEKASNYASTMVEHIRKGSIVCTEQEKGDRLAICFSCENLNKEARCNLCGCPVEEKAALKISECPDNPPRWKKMALPLLEAKPCDCGS